MKKTNKKSSLTPKLSDGQTDTTRESGPTNSEAVRSSALLGDGRGYEIIDSDLTIHAESSEVTRLLSSASVPVLQFLFENGSLSSCPCPDGIDPLLFAELSQLERQIEKAREGFQPSKCHPSLGR